MAARRQPGWASIPEMGRPTEGTDVELLGLRAIAAILNRMTEPERARTLTWVLNKYTPTVRLIDEDD